MSGLWIEGRLQKLAALEENHPANTMRISKAVELACDVHTNQIDKSGQPYILHVMRVMTACYPDESAMIVGVLHDVWEDHPETVRPKWMTACEWQALRRLTRGPEVSYSTYILQLAGNSLARQVKIADLYDNLRIERLMRVPEADVARLVRKYLRALVALGVMP